MRKSKSIQMDVVITTGGRYDMLRKCLEALRTQSDSVSLGVYIIDNASNIDDRRANEDVYQDKGWFSEFKTKRLSQEVGFPASNNEAARMGHAPIIVFLNDDVELHPNSIQSVLSSFNDPTVGVVGIKLLFPPSSTSPIRPAGKVQHVGMAFNIRGDVFHPLVGWSSSNPRTCVDRDVVCVTGACLAIRRSLFNKVGGFSLEYGRGTWEDVDLCFKARSNGYRVFVNTKAVGFHYTGATQEKKNVFYPLQQNRTIFHAKWGPSNMIAWTEIDFW